MKIWRQKLMSPLLANSEFTDYLIEQYDQIQSNCSTSLPLTTYSARLLVSTAVATTTTSGTVSAPTASSTCLGQLIDPPAYGFTCDDLTDTYNITTGDARAATKDVFCQFNTTICIPNPCELDTIWDSPSWYLLLQSAGFVKC